jgi:hypothetical protein
LTDKKDQDQDQDNPTPLGLVTSTATVCCFIEPLPHNLARWHATT